jgi:hypothetical protein
MLLGVNGRSDFDGRHSRQHNDEVQFYAFDVLMSDGDELRKLPLSIAACEPGAIAGAWIRVTALVKNHALS